MRHWTHALLAAAALLGSAGPGVAQDASPFDFPLRFEGDRPMPVFTRPQHRFGGTLLADPARGGPSLLDPEPFGSLDDPSSALRPAEPVAAPEPARPAEPAEARAEPRAEPRPPEQTASVPAPRERALGRGLAAWYEHPGRTASGEVYRPDGLTAAHSSLPLGSRVRVVNTRNGRSVVVRINDRYSGKRRIAIDLSRGAAKRLGIEGMATVALTLVSAPAPERLARN